MSKTVIQGGSKDVQRYRVVSLFPKIGRGPDLEGRQDRTAPFTATGEVTVGRDSFETTGPSVVLSSTPGIKANVPVLDPRKLLAALAVLVGAALLLLGR